MQLIPKEVGFAYAVNHCATLDSSYILTGWADRQIGDIAVGSFGPAQAC